ncbi:MAG: hypothetical protein JNM63_11505, partial [Spirochaetia bacterium]|nr:hypothetical protein [Spirochaetia bacterium]
RNGLHGKHINLVWNSYVSATLDKLEKNWDQVADTMKWWTELVPTLKSLGETRAVSSRVGAVLSWPDMYYRTRAYRWYAMPGRSMDENLRQAGVFPVEWVSGLTPASVYDGLDLVFASPDAFVWDKDLCLKLKAFVERGGKLVILGKSGQLTPGEKKEYFGPDLLGKPMQSGAENFCEWKSGRGKVAWVPGAMEHTSNIEKTISENREPVLAALKWAGFQPKAVSANPKIETFILTDGKKEFLIASHYLGQVAIRNKFDLKKEKPDLEKTRIHLNLPDPNMKIRFKALAGPEPVETNARTAAEWSKKGLTLSLLSTEFSILEIEKP